MKLLIVSLKHPEETTYFNPEKVDVFMWGRRLSEYAFLAVSDDGTVNPIILKSADITDIKTQVMEELK
jgi:hypothetical protein